MMHVSQNLPEAKEAIITPNAPEEMLREERSPSEILHYYLRHVGIVGRRRSQPCLSSELYQLAAAHQHRLC